MPHWGLGSPLPGPPPIYPNTPHWSNPSCPGVAQRGNCASLPWVFRVAHQLVGATPTHAHKTSIMPPWAKWLTATAWRCPPPSRPTRPGAGVEVGNKAPGPSPCHAMPMPTHGGAGPQQRFRRGLAARCGWPSQGPKASQQGQAWLANSHGYSNRLLV